MMESDRWSQVKDVLAAAMETPAGQRARVLDELCGDDADLRAEVESLLDAHDDLGKGGGVLGDQDHPERIGRYKVLRPIAKGGMGVVYLAEQTEPIQRQVAIKLIQLGMDTREVVARFDVERQALALMNHPHIAQVHDAGSTEAGRPYFVMEHVPGVPITEYCDSGNLAIRERLELFLKVCDAIQHAHQKGVVHRDVKPSNVLVMRRDGEAVPKIIDFGVAKATSLQLARQTLFTRSGLIIGTPEYVSPEQASMTEAGVDTRTDVYALGVLLYELLTGQLPFGRSTDPDTPLDEILRRIRLEEPVRPSSRIAALREEATDVARTRRSDTRTMMRTLRGDLDWIVLRALEKDPGRRYASASELAADVRRFMADEPVEARPPSVRYRAGKFLARHRLGVAATVAVFVALGALSVTLGVQARRLAVERDKVKVEAATAQQLASFMEDMFDFANPSVTGGIDITVDQVLATGAGNIRTALHDEPAVRARLLNALARVHHRLSRLDEAEHMATEAREIQEQTLGPDDPEVAPTLMTLADVASTRSDFQLAIELGRQAIAMLEAAHGPDALVLAEPLGLYGNALREKGEYEMAEAVLLRRLAITEANPEASAEDYADCFANLVGLHQDERDLSKAEEYARRALDVLERELPSNHPRVAAATSQLANVIAAQGLHEYSLPLAERALQILLEVYGERHNRTAFAYYNLGVMNCYAGNVDVGMDHLDRALTAWTEVLGPDNENNAWVWSMYGRIHINRNELDKANEALQRALRIFGTVFGEDHFRYVHTQTRIGFLRLRQGRMDESRHLLKAGLDWKLRLASAPDASARAKYEFARDLLHIGHPELLDPEQALRFAREAVAMTEREDAVMLDLLAHAYFDVGDAARAFETQKEAISKMTPKLEERRAAYEQRLEEYRNALDETTETS